MKNKKLVTYVLEAALGDLAEGTVLSCEEEKGAALVSAGLAREATEEDVSGGTDEEAPEEETADEPEMVTDALKGLDIEGAVTKATEKAVEKITSQVKRPAFAGAYAGGSDLHLTGGFKNLGDATLCFLRKSKGDYDAARRFSQYTKALDARRTKGQMSISGGSGHQGGDLVPIEWTKDLWKLAFTGVPDLLGMCDKRDMQHETLKVPVWVQASAATGIQSNVVDEADPITDTVGVTDTVTLELKKNAVLVNLTDELLRFNAYSVESEIKSVVPQRIRFKTNGAMVNGNPANGVNLIGNAATVTVTRQTAGQINFNDTVNMFTSLHDDFVEGSAWFTSQKNAAWLYNMPYPNRAATNQIPAFVAGGFQDFGNGARPLGMLHGLPIYRLENIPTVGTKGDIILWHPKSCVAGYTELIGDSTPALYFDLAVNSLRFLFYSDAANRLTVPYTYADGTQASNTIVLSGTSSSS